MIVKNVNSTDTKINLEIDNGDLQALKESIEKFGFIDEQAALRFALFALLKAENNKLYVDEGEKRVIITPSATSLKTNESKNI